jgi:iron complex transport system substrate-binding protein
MRAGGRLRKWVLVMLLSLALTPCLAQAESIPARVVSINLCTDQLAMLLAAPGQLYSVSHLAAQTDLSALAGQARQYAPNHGLAEEIFVMKPDLVLAGTFTTRATIGMLRRLGFRVEEFAPAASFADIESAVQRLGGLLGQQAKADQLLQHLNEELARYGRAPEKRPSAATYYANNYTSGRGTLMAEAMQRAGLSNMAETLGAKGVTRLPLEVLVMNAPDLLIGSARQPRAPALAEEMLAHPALRAIAGSDQIAVPDKYWLCGTPFTAEAVRVLGEAAARRTQ